MLRRTLVLAAALLAALVSVSAGFAQTATPFAGRETPDPSLCVAAPLIGTPVASTTESTPAASPSAATPVAMTEPSGQAADAATTAAVTAVVREFYACLNANAPDRAIALFTQAGTSSLLVQRPDLTPAATTTTGTPTPLAVQNQIALVAITDVRVLPGGQVFALVTQDDPNRPPDGPEPVFVIFAKQGSAWLIDEIQYLASA